MNWVWNKLVHFISAWVFLHYPIGISECFQVLQYNFCRPKSISKVHSTRFIERQVVWMAMLICWLLSHFCPDWNMSTIWWIAMKWHLYFFNEEALWLWWSSPGFVCEIVMKFRTVIFPSGCMENLGEPPSFSTIISSKFWFVQYFDYDEMPAKVIPISVNHTLVFVLISKR